MVDMLGSSAVLLFLSIAYVLVPGAMSKTFVFTNKCHETIYPGVLTLADRPPFPTTGFELQHGVSKSCPNVRVDWSGRIWARHRCSTDASGRFSCASGDCGSGQVECNGSRNAPPATLAEFTLGGDGGTEFFDISNVDGFNVPIMVHHPFGVPESCTTVACVEDINASCPPELAVRAPDGSTVGCKSACLAFDKDEFCCRGAYSTPDTCKPSNYSMFFKENCPQAYSYAYDDKSSTFTCHGASYNIIFCPRALISSFS